MYTEYLEIHIRIHTYIIKQLQVIYMHVSIYTQILEEKNQLLGKTVKKKDKTCILPNRTCCEGLQNICFVYQ